MPKLAIHQKGESHDIGLIGSPLQFPKREISQKQLALIAMMQDTINALEAERDRMLADIARKLIRGDKIESGLHMIELSHEDLDVKCGTCT